jgi:hypothetical protein
MATGFPIVRNSIARNMSNGFLPASRNAGEPCEVSGCQVGPINADFAGGHENAIEPLGHYCNPLRIFNNVIHDTIGVTILVGSPAGDTSYIYNNLIYNSGPIPISLDGRDTSGYHEAHLYNNTIVGAGGVAVRVGGAGVWQYADIQNNHFLDVTSAVSSTGVWIDNISAPTIYINNNNLNQTPAEAISSGYTLSNNFKPTSATSPTVGAGVNFSNVDPTNYPSIRRDLLGNSRPSAGPWDIGAYEYVPGGILYGDVSGDGRVSAYDAALTTHDAVGLITFTPAQLQAGDVDDNGSITAYDAALIAQKAVGLISKFPVEG